MLDERTQRALAEKGIDSAQFREAVKPLFLLLHQIDASYATLLRIGSECRLTIGWKPQLAEGTSADDDDDLEDAARTLIYGDDDPDDEDDFDDDDEWWDDDDEEEEPPWVDHEPYYETPALRYLAETWEGDRG